MALDFIDKLQPKNLNSLGKLWCGKIRNGFLNWTEKKSLAELSESFALCHFMHARVNRKSFCDQKHGTSSYDSYEERSEKREIKRIKVGQRRRKQLFESASLVDFFSQNFHLIDANTMSFPPRIMTGKISSYRENNLANLNIRRFCDDWQSEKRKSFCT